MKRFWIILILLALVLTSCDLLLPPEAPAATMIPAVPASTKTRTAVVLPTPTEIGTPAVNQLPQAIFHDCPFENSTIKIECGSLFVKETRSDPDSNVIEIAFVRYRAQLQVPAPDPVVYLGSQIGYPNLINIEDTWSEFPLLYNRDLILFDPRGSGSSLPSLDCPAIDETRGYYDPGGIGSCYDKLLAEGINLNSYNSVSIAQDVIDLIHELGYGRANLIGSDYGSRIALTVLRDNPERVRSVVLDSPIPINVNYFNEKPLYFYEVFNSFLAEFLEDEQNYEIFGEFESVFYDLVRTLEFDPIVFNFENANGVEEEIVIGAGDVVTNFQEMLSTTGFLPAIPAYFSLLYNGDFERAYEIYLEQEANIAPQTSIVPGSKAEGLALSMLCHEEVGFNDLVTARSMIEIYQKEVSDYLLAELEEYFSLCEIWSVEQADSSENISFTSTIPILILSGQYDTTSPATWGKRLVIDFPNTYFYEFPEMGHILFSNQICTVPLIEEFINYPNNKPANTCVDRLDPVQYIIP